MVPETTQSGVIVHNTPPSSPPSPPSSTTTASILVTAATTTATTAATTTATLASTAQNNLPIMPLSCSSSSDGRDVHNHNSHSHNHIHTYYPHHYPHHHQHQQHHQHNQQHHSHPSCSSTHHTVQQHHHITSPAPAPPTPKAIGVDIVTELCGLILHDRLATDVHQAEMPALVAAATSTWIAHNEVVLSIHIRDVVLESWALTLLSPSAPLCSDIKPMLRSLLCFSTYNAWRRGLGQKASAQTMLRSVTVSINTAAASIPITDAALQSCPPVDIHSSKALLLTVSRTSRSVFDSIPLPSTTSTPTPTISTTPNSIASLDSHTAADLLYHAVGSASEKGIGIGSEKGMGGGSGRGPAISPPPPPHIIPLLARSLTFPPIATTTVAIQITTSTTETNQTNQTAQTTPATTHSPHPQPQLTTSASTLFSAAKTHYPIHRPMVVSAHHSKPPLSSPDPRRRITNSSNEVVTSPICIPTTTPRPRAASLLISPRPDLHSMSSLASPPLGGAMLSGSRPRSTSISRSPRSSCLLGNYEESLLAGSLPSFAARPVDGFTADISASGLVSSKRVRLPVAVKYYKIPEQEAPSPYVGTIDLCAGLASEKRSGHYRVPSTGVLQVLVSNPEKTGIKVFILKYDFRAMPPNTHTFLRQRTFVGQSHGPHRSTSHPQYAIHVRFCSSKSGKIFLYKDIRILLAPRAPDMTEYQHTTTEGPSDPIYAPLDAPSHNNSAIKSSPSTSRAVRVLVDSAIVTSPTPTTSTDEDIVNPLLVDVQKRLFISAP